LGLRVWGFGFWSSELGAWVLGSEVYQLRLRFNVSNPGLGFEIQGLRFKVEG
jgi:hypothetical protein